MNNPTPVSQPNPPAEADAWSLRVCELAEAAELPVPVIRVTSENLTLDWLDRPGVTARFCYFTNTVTMRTVTSPAVKALVLPADPDLTVAHVKDVYLLADRSRLRRLIAFS